MQKSLFIAFQFHLNSFLLYSPNGMYYFFKTHIVNMMYFSLSLAFCLKMYRSEDVALELPES
jgi:hypothetical protein